MSEPRVLTASERDALWAEVRAEFPGDAMMQEVHFVRLLHAAQLGHLTDEERRAYFNRLVPRPSERDSE